MAGSRGIAGSAMAARRRSALPYLLSLPALIVTIGILIPFVTAVSYSLQRYNLAMPMTRGFVWFDQYVGFFGDASKR